MNENGKLMLDVLRFATLLFREEGKPKDDMDTESRMKFCD